MAFTFFFRDMQILELAIRHVVPFAMGRSRVRVWDAGCAMGPEPYSLAIMLAEQMGYFAFKNLTIIASDIDDQDTFGETIRKGVYTYEELQRAPKDLFEKYFKPAAEKGHYEIIDPIKRSVQFMKHNLLSLKAIGNDFTFIMCKNVLLHFQQSERIEVIRMFHGALVDGGYFATEQTQKMPEEVRPLFEHVVGDGQIHKKNGVGK